MDEDTAGLIVKGLDSEPIRNLFGPLTKQLGELGGNIGSVVEYYCTGALRGLFKEWAQQRDNRPLSAAEFGRVLPLLLTASFQTENELQERWAALLESVATCRDDVLPSFGQTLSQLTTEEALFLSRIYASPMKDRLIRPVPLKTLHMIYAPELESVPYNEHPRQEEKIKHATLLIQDLERLGILSRQQESKNVGHIGWEDTGKLVTTYSLSDYGRRFIEAVTPKTPSAMPG